MNFRLKKKNLSITNNEDYEIVIESSICTGEKLIGFKNKVTSKLEKAMLIKTQKDIDEFYKKYNINK